jgi:predicted nucleic acid-binding Zn ribbon protein
MTDARKGEKSVTRDWRWFLTRLVAAAVAVGVWVALRSNGVAEVATTPVVVVAAVATFLLVESATGRQRRTNLPEDRCRIEERERVLRKASVRFVLAAGLLVVGLLLASRNNAPLGSGLAVAALLYLIYLAYGGALRG